MLGFAVRFFALGLLMSGCGFVSVESIDAGADVGVADVNAADVGVADVGVADVGVADAITSCGPVTSGGCPNETAMIGPESPSFTAEGLTLRGQADNLNSPCVGAGSADWSVLLEATAAGRINPTVTPGGRLALATWSGGCDGEPLSCNRPAPTSSSLLVAAGDRILLAVEALDDSCDRTFRVAATFTSTP